MRDHEKILQEDGVERLLKAKLFLTQEESKYSQIIKRKADISWCNDCFEMSWELQKAHVLYKHIKKEAQQFIPLNYNAEYRSGTSKKDWLARKKSYDPSLHLQGSIP